VVQTVSSWLTLRRSLWYVLQDQWTSRAELAVKAGEDELAREALKKRKAFEEQMSTWKVQLEQQEKAMQQLLDNTVAMERKLSEAKAKKETLKARAASAKSSKQVRVNSIILRQTMAVITCMHAG